MSTAGFTVHPSDYGLSEATAEIEDLMAYRSHRGPAWIVSPHSTSKFCWDVAITLMIIYCCVAVPECVVLEKDSVMLGLIADYVIDTSFLLDTALGFMTGFFAEEGIYITDLRKIAKRYVTTWFMADLVSSAPYDLIVNAVSEGPSKELQRKLRLTKMIRLLKLGKVALEVWRRFSIDPILLRPASVFFMTFMFAHFINCAWFFGVQDINIANWSLGYIHAVVPGALLALLPIFKMVHPQAPDRPSTLGMGRLQDRLSARERSRWARGQQEEIREELSARLASADPAREDG